MVEAEMPFTGERKREYQRAYMRARRAAAKEGRPWAFRKARPTVRDELVALTARVAQLEADLAAARGRDVRI
jgi:hypothetical protein